LFCPKCKSEYVAGYTRCSNCGLELVEKLPVPEARNNAQYVAPPLPDVTAFVPRKRSSNPFTRFPLAWFLLLPPLICLVQVSLPRFHNPVDIRFVATALLAILICWAIGRRREGPRRTIMRLGLLLVVAAVYELAQLLLLRPTFAPGYPHRLGTLLGETLPAAVVAALLVQNTFSPNAALRALVQPLGRWRAPWFVYVIALLAWPLLVLLVVLLSRVLPSAQPAPGLDLSYVTGVLRFSVVSLLSLAPWALAWFGYGVPVLLYRISALAVGLLLGLLMWLPYAIPWFVHVHQATADPYLNLGGDLALAVVAIWLYQRARGSVWPVLVLVATTESFLLINWAGDGFGQWFDSA
jgi:hypothetical protein